MTLAKRQATHLLIISGARAHTPPGKHWLLTLGPIKVTGHSFVQYECIHMWHVVRPLHDRAQVFHCKSTRRPCIRLLLGRNFCADLPGDPGPQVDLRSEQGAIDYQNSVDSSLAYWLLHSRALWPP